MQDFSNYSCGCWVVARRYSRLTIFIASMSVGDISIGSAYHYLTIINKKVRFSCTCNRSTRCELFNLIVPFVLYVWRIFFWRIDRRLIGLELLQNVRCVLLFHTRAHILLHVCSLYRGFLCWRNQKSCSLFRVGRCSLYRGLFTAKIDRGDRDTPSYRRCSLYRGFTV
jgi:hypothetical protein